MNNIFKGLLVFALIAFVTSCQKKDNTPAYLSKVSVTFTAPASGQAFHKGDTVNINAAVTYISEINGLGLQIIDTATGNVLFSDDHDLHTDHFALSGTWVDTLANSAVLQVKVSVFVANSISPAIRTTYISSSP
jgi:hypothetical protein